MTTAKPMGTRTPALAESLLSDEKPKRRAGRYECSHMVRGSPLDASRMAQEVVGGQAFLQMEREGRRGGFFLMPPDVRSSILGANRGVVSPGREGGPPYSSLFRRSNRPRSRRLLSLTHWRPCFQRSLAVDSIKKVRCDGVNVERSTPISFKAGSNCG